MTFKIRCTRNEDASLQVGAPTLAHKQRILFAIVPVRSKGGLALLFHRNLGGAKHWMACTFTLSISRV